MIAPIAVLEHGSTIIIEYHHQLGTSTAIDISCFMRVATRVEYHQRPNCTTAVNVSLTIHVTTHYYFRQAGVVEGGTLSAKELHCICVFARMRPDEKERIIVSLRAGGAVCLMCGDGANDVGALKQAQVCRHISRHTIYHYMYIHIMYNYMYMYIYGERVYTCRCSIASTCVVIVTHVAINDIVLLTL
jgi:haloacid dehalogenase-like hydrolase